MPVVRAPAVAGRFYPGDPAALAAEVKRCLEAGPPAPSAPPASPAPPTRAVGLVAPHAGYVYSGRCAGATFRRVAVPKRVILIGPNHTGRGVPVSVSDADAFRIPGADVPIDAPLRDAILAHVPGARRDARAHEHEHSLEVELPFLLARQPDLTIVPIVLGFVDGEGAVKVGEGLARAVAAAGLGPDDVLVVASSDMSHYLPDDVARERDRPAIERLLALDPLGLWQTCEAQDISMCGVLPATAMLAYARARGANRAELACYATSGDAFGDRDRVVGYAGVIVVEA